MANTIHPTALIHSEAQLGSGITVGPYAIIDSDVQIGDDCRIGPYVHLTGHTRIGHRNVFHSGCVIGDAPQDLSYSGAPTRTEIGDDNTFREHVTINRSNNETEITTIGCKNFFMANSHAGHNSQVHNNVILANGAMIGGHAIIEDNVFLGGNAGVHQFCRVGRLSFIAGNGGASQDIPPFIMISRINELSGLNAVGLKRSGAKPDERLQIKKLYHFLFREGRTLSGAVAEATESFPSPLCQELLTFIKSSKRGVTTKLRT